MGNGKVPVDRYGQELQVGDRVRILNPFDGGVLYESVVIGFKEGPGYDPTCVGICVEGNPLHPSLVERMEEGR